MSINGAAIIFAIALWKIQRVAPQHWLIIKLLPACLGALWLWQHPAYVLNMSVNGASTTFGLASWKMQRLPGNSKLSSNYRPPCYVIIDATTSLFCPKNDPQWTSHLATWTMQGLSGDIDL
jgi:hypothetical protein